MPSLSRRAVALACVLASGMTFYYFALLLPSAHHARAAKGLDQGYAFGSDFYSVWLTSHELLIRKENPYTADMVRKMQVGLYGRALDPQRAGEPPQNFARYPYPLYLDLFVAPLGRLSFETARIVNAVLLPIVFCATVLLWLSAVNFRLAPLNRFVLLILSFATYPILEGLYALQVSLIVAALIAASAACLAKRRLALAGLLLAAASVKPQLILLPAVFLALWAVNDWKTRKSFLLFFVGTIAFLFAVSEAILPGWSATWIRTLFEYRKYNDPPLTRFLFGNLVGNLLALCLFSAAAVLAFRNRAANADSVQFVGTLVVTLAVTVPTLPSTIAVYDQVLLVPAILWLLFRKNQILHGKLPVRSIGYLTITVVTWQWIAASGLDIWFLLFQKIPNSAWIVLPLRMTPAIPFAVIALCLLLRLEIMPAKAAARSG